MLQARSARLETKLDANNAKLDANMSEFSQQLVSVRNHVDFFGGQLEALGHKVEVLEACDEGEDFNEEEYDDDGVEEDEVERLQNDAAQALGNEQQRPPRTSRRSAAAVLGNHGKNRKLARRLLPKARSHRR